MTPGQFFRNYVMPLFSADEIKHLHKALSEDDPKLIQNKTSEFVNGKCEGACLLTYPTFRENPDITFDELEMKFTKLYNKINFGNEFIDWFDFNSKEKIKTELLPELTTYLENINEEKDSK